MSVVLASWLAVSYVSGRYSPAANGERTPWSSQLSKTLIAGGSVIAVFIGHSWLYQVVDAQTRFRGFLIPFVLGACLLSLLGQAFGSRLGDRRRCWIVLGNEKETLTIAKEIEEEGLALLSRTSFGEINSIVGCLNGGSDYPIGLAVGGIETDTRQDIDRLLRLREKGECVIPLMSWCEQELQRIPPELVHSEWLIQAEGFGLRPGSFSWRVKRFGDVIGASILLCLTTPLIVLSAILIWMEDRGPVLYQQIRSGLYGRPIRIWKLRSMRVNAEQTGAQWASKADPRITSVVRLIRATRIDELPQLLSVLNGDLSLIGPRPERPEIEADLEVKIPNYRVRHWIRPGLSGWAQVCFPYGASVSDSRMKLSYDLYYLRNASIALDILILLKTAKLVMRGQGSQPSANRQK